MSLVDNSPNTPLVCFDPISRILSCCSSTFTSLRSSNPMLPEPPSPPSPCVYLSITAIRWRSDMCWRQSKTPFFGAIHHALLLFASAFPPQKEVALVLSLWLCAGFKHRSIIQISRLQLHCRPEWCALGARFCWDIARSDELRGSCADDIHHLRLRAAL